ncbi:sulfur carrier protein ThiS [Deinococcus cellulosilyticus]|uniref:Thiamine biosynthesis protein ThiS n=1 Tax=Deinococcus cellulosilyticus (strain DSM 18568 / NBRC 106333 / KACC 11606 / 5516J-15) TaxID=1223518 RepID=A0A511N6L4_DEIC1|nr:sulfur carrier protein ThiS [Deinococcus cellulosilyticus]GEM48076.1 hypothetical protein DC3_37110 [Deinococcus cellulosilyticus NBRC 106333 = KACC 11606]
MQVNGQDHTHQEGLTLFGLLNQFGIAKERVAVMVNDQIYPAGQLEDVVLQPDDVIEIVKAMQGG